MVAAAAPTLPSRRVRVRAIVAAVAVLWLIAGTTGLGLYLNRYWIYRGFPPPATPVGVETGKVVKETFASAALHGRRGYSVYLPPGYAAAAAAGQRFPVLYLLHGKPGRPEQFTDIANLAVDANVLLHRHAIRPMLIVMPRGRRWVATEWANAGGGRYEDFLLEIVRNVDQRFPTLADRSHRAIGGLSDGAYGAINVGLRNLGVFGGIQSWSGYYTQAHSGAFAHATSATVLANSPAAYVGSLAPAIRRAPLRAYLYTGNRNPGIEAATATFAGQLQRAGARVVWRVAHGGHDWSLWRRQTPHMLRVASGWFATPLRGHA